MDNSETFEIFLVAAPGLEKALCEEALEAGFASAKAVPGGVTGIGGWPDVWRANLDLRGAVRVLARIGSFRAFHLAQLDKRARKFPWGAILRPDVSVKVEVTCKKSKIYHAGAASQRIERAIAEELGAKVGPEGDVSLKVRIDDNLCTFSVNTSGESLHKRGTKMFTGKAPMRETLAALFLRECGYDGTEPVVDPMCGSGTFVLEAAEIAAGLQPGRGREFAFEKLANFDPEALAALRRETRGRDTGPMFFGFDRDSGAIRGAEANAERAGISDLTSFSCQPLSELQPPEGPKGLVMINPPYGARIGNKKMLYALYGSLGKVLTERFAGWRVGIVTSDTSLAKATGLPFLPPGPPVANGGLKVKLFKTDALGS